ncbi:MAG TPA: hypothetical protein VLA13_02165 [Massilibacterium sp.]|nr:hypothetical protein [Massilibacterium sp.]
MAKVFKTISHIAKKQKHVEKVHECLQTSIVNIQMKAGEKISKHEAKESVLVIVRKGKLAFDVSGETIELTNENILQMEPFESHSLEAIEDTDFILIKIEG